MGGVSIRESTRIHSIGEAVKTQNWTSLLVGGVTLADHPPQVLGASDGRVGGNPRVHKCGCDLWRLEG